MSTYLLLSLHACFAWCPLIMFNRSLIVNVQVGVGRHFQQGEYSSRRSVESSSAVLGHVIHRAAGHQAISLTQVGVTIAQAAFIKDQSLSN